ncbi:MAG: hypothetical protein DRI32_00390, partial [Chloroflexi bacterium]
EKKEDFYSAQFLDVMGEYAYASLERSLDEEERELLYSLLIINGTRLMMETKPSLSDAIREETEKALTRVSQSVKDAGLKFFGPTRLSLRDIP